MNIKIWNLTTFRWYFVKKLKLWLKQNNVNIGPELLFPESITLAVKSHFQTWLLVLRNMRTNAVGVLDVKPSTSEWDFRETMGGNIFV